MFQFLKKRPGGLLELQNKLLSPDGSMFFHKGEWRRIPAGGADNMIKGNSDWYDDFLLPFGAAATSLIGSRSIYTVASSATFARLPINGGAGVATLAGDDADVVSVFGPRAYEPNEAGRMWMQTRIRTSIIDAASLFIGFTDSDADTVIIEDEDGTLNTVPTDAFGILLESEQDATWQTMGVGNDVDDTQAVATNIDDLAASTWTTIYIEAFEDGNTAKTVVRYRVRIDGKILRTASTDTEGFVISAARSSIIYCPVVSADDRNTAYTLDIAEYAAKGGVGSSLD